MITHSSQGSSSVGVLKVDVSASLEVRGIYTEEYYRETIIANTFCNRIVVK